MPVNRACATKSVSRFCSIPTGISRRGSPQSALSASPIQARRAADQRLLGEIHSRYTDIANALPRLLTADNNTNFAESGPYLDNRPQALEGAEIDSDAISLVSTAKSDATNVSRQNQASYAELQHLFIGVATGGGALVLLVALALCLWLVRPTRKAGIGAPLQSTIEP